MYRTERNDSDNPMDTNPDDSICHHCSHTLVELDPKANFELNDEQYFAFEGFCGARCAAEHLAGLKTNLYTHEFMLRIAKRVMLADYERRNVNMAHKYPVFRKPTR